MGMMASQITSLTVVYSTVYSWRRSKETSKLRVTGLCEGNSPLTDEFLAQMARNAENVSIWWRHHERLHAYNDEAMQDEVEWYSFVLMFSTPDTESALQLHKIILVVVVNIPPHINNAEHCRDPIVNINPCMKCQQI